MFILVFFAVTASVTLQLKHTAERQMGVERDLQAIVSELNAQDAQEWRVVSRRVPSAEVAPVLARSRARVTTLLEQAGSEGASSLGIAETDTVFHRYTTAVDEELRLLAVDDVEAAEAQDRAQVDPAFEAANKTLTALTTRAHAQAERASKLSDAGLVFSIGCALLLMAVVQSRRRFTDVRREQAARSEARYRALVDQSADVVIVIGQDSSLQYSSPAAERLFRGRVHETTTARDMAGLVHPDDREPLATALQQAPSQRVIAPLGVRFDAGSADGQDQAWRTFEVRVQDLTDNPAINGLVLTGHDVTGPQRMQDEMRHRAMHDPLTGLANRTLLAERCTQALLEADRTGSAVGLLVLDLDRFKEINDTLGHHYGDELLSQMGPRLTEALRAGDTVARLGGDEFAVLLPSVAGVQAPTEVAQKIQAALGRSFVVDGIDLDVEVSIGVAVSGVHGNDVTNLLQRADIAMFVAKRRNVGVSVYDPDANTHTPERLALLGGLRRALQNRELILHYQPKVSLSTGDVCGAEALVRWQHPERGLVSPDDFIPLAENTGLIGPLTLHVLDLALAQWRLWIDAGNPLKMAVNLSARNLLDDDLDQMVAELLMRHRVPASLLQFEITETAITVDPVRTREVLQRLAALGVLISIDDFGAGYTSIRQLRDLPISELKIDRSFIDSITDDDSDGLIVRSVIELSHSLGLTAVAEGVETLDTYDRLRALECDVAQGYHISRPLTASAFDLWRPTWRDSTVRT